MTILSDDMLRLAAIRRARNIRTNVAVVFALLSTQLLFWAWIYGFETGPSPLTHRDVLLGATMALVLAAVVCIPFRAREQLRGASFSTTVREGRKTRTAAAYADHLVLGDEIILFSTLRSLEPVDDGLRLSYSDLTRGMAAARHLEAPTKQVAALMNALPKIKPVEESA